MDDPVASNLVHAAHLLFAMFDAPADDRRTNQARIDEIIRTEVTRCAPNYMGPRAPDGVCTWAVGRGFTVGDGSTPANMATSLRNCLDTICKACGDRPYWGLQSDFRQNLFFVPVYRKETELYDPVTKRMVPV